MKIFNKILLTLLSLFFVPPVLATNSDPGGGGTGDPPTLFSGIDTILGSVTKLILPIAGLICVVFIIIGGYTWIASAGDPAKVKQAQGTLTWAIIGLVFILIAEAVIMTIVNFVS